MADAGNMNGGARGKQAARHTMEPDDPLPRSSWTGQTRRPPTAKPARRPVIRDRMCDNIIDGAGDDWRTAKRREKSHALVNEKPFVLALLQPN